MNLPTTRIHPDAFARQVPRGEGTWLRLCRAKTLAGSPLSALRSQLSLRSPLRRGGILAAVLVTLLVVVLVSAGVTRAIVMHHRQMRLAEQRQQALWLAESAVQRALAAVAENPRYRGEVWQVPAEALGTGESGMAIISVENTMQPSKNRVIRVEASYPHKSTHRSLYKREVFVESTPLPGGPP